MSTISDCINEGIDNNYDNRLKNNEKYMFVKLYDVLLISYLCNRVFFLRYSTSSTEPVKLTIEQKTTS